MKLPEDARRLRIYIGEEYRYKGRPLYEAIVEKARRDGLAGATVLRGVMGFGAGSRVRSSKILVLSADLPLVVEIVDKPERIEAFLPWLDQVIGKGMFTLEEVRVAAYRHGPA